MESITIISRTGTIKAEQYCRRQKLDHLIVYARGKASKENPNLLYLSVEDYVRHARLITGFLDADIWFQNFVQDLVGVQPMSGPTAQIFTMRYSYYGSTRITTKIGFQKWVLTRPGIWLKYLRRKIHNWWSRI